ncbi:MAG: hypothetical protein J0H39_13975 [Alphaproteobacteria bacterium]|nr:hypothetical protein [Alphaproteobacteria bacterium]
MITAKVKDRPGLLDDAERLRRAGRNGDHLIAHITPQEAALLKARGGSGTINPRTGLLEFFDTSDPMGGASDYGYGGDQTDADRAGSENATNDLVGAINEAAAATDIIDPFSAIASNQVGPKSMPAYADTRGFLGMIGDNVLANFQDMAARPGETLTNLALGALVPGYSLINAAVAAGKPGNTLAGYALDAAKGGVMSEYMGADEAPSTPTDPDGFASDSRGGTGEQGQAPFQRTGMFGGETTTDQIVRDAIRRAIVYKPGAYNSWQGNRFVIPDIQW